MMSRQNLFSKLFYSNQFYVYNVVNFFILIWFSVVGCFGVLSYSVYLVLLQIEKWCQFCNKNYALVKSRQPVIGFTRKFFSWRPESFFGVFFKTLSVLIYSQLFKLKRAIYSLGNFSRGGLSLMFVFLFFLFKYNFGYLYVYVFINRYVYGLFISLLFSGDFFWFFAAVSLLSYGTYYLTQQKTYIVRNWQYGVYSIFILYCNVVLDRGLFKDFFIFCSNVFTAFNTSDHYATFFLAKHIEVNHLNTPILAINTVLTQVSLSALQAQSVGYLLLFFINWAGISYLKKYNYKTYEYYVLFMLNIGGSMLLLKAANLLTIYVLIEVLSLSMYPLLAMRYSSYYSLEAALKYFIFNSVAAGFLLIGFAFMYGNLYQTQLFTYNAFAISYINESSIFLTIGLYFISFAFLLKIASFPFHAWAPDVYDGGSLFLVSYLMVFNKFVMVYIFIRIFTFYTPLLTFNVLIYYHYLFLLIGVISMVIGCFGGLLQTRIKRLLGYSAISQAGFFLYSIGPSFLLGDFTTFYFYFFSYVLTLVLFFNVLMTVCVREQQFSLYITDLQGLREKNLAASLLLSVALFSLIGLPPTLGFLGKYFVLHQLLSLKGYLSFYFGLVMVILNLVSGFYYLKLIKIINFDKPSSSRELGVTNSASLSGFNISNILLGFIIIVGVHPQISGFIWASCCTLNDLNNMSNTCGI